MQTPPFLPKALAGLKPWPPHWRPSGRIQRRPPREVEASRPWKALRLVRCTLVRSLAWTNPIPAQPPAAPPPPPPPSSAHCPPTPAPCSRLVPTQPDLSPSHPRQLGAPPPAQLGAVTAPGLFTKGLALHFLYSGNRFLKRPGWFSSSRASGTRRGALLTLCGSRCCREASGQQADDSLGAQPRGQGTGHLPHLLFPLAGRGHSPPLEKSSGSVPETHPQGMPSSSRQASAPDGGNTATPGPRAACAQKTSLSQVKNILLKRAEAFKHFQKSSDLA